MWAPCRTHRLPHAGTARLGRGDAHKGNLVMGWILGIIYFVLLVTLGIVSLRKGHWVMFIIGLFIPLFWFIGALLPRRVVRV